MFEFPKRFLILCSFIFWRCVIRYFVIAVTFFLATAAVTVWHNRSAELETASTYTQVFAHCVVGISGDRYTAKQFVPCMRAGFYRAVQNRHHARVLRTQDKLERTLSEVRKARATLNSWMEE